MICVKQTPVAAAVGVVVIAEHEHGARCTRICQFTVSIKFQLIVTRKTCKDKYKVEMKKKKNVA